MTEAEATIEFNKPLSVGSVVLWGAIQFANPQINCLGEIKKIEPYWKNNEYTKAKITFELKTGLT